MPIYTNKVVREIEEDIAPLLKHLGKEVYIKMAENTDLPILTMLIITDSIIDTLRKLFAVCHVTDEHEVKLVKPVSDINMNCITLKFSGQIGHHKFFWIFATIYCPY